jgi:hypothetical protein
VGQNSCNLSASRALLYRAGRVSLIVIALLIGGPVVRGARSSTNAQSQGTQVTTPPAEAWVRTELFFGLTDRNGHLVSMRSWLHFEDTVLTPAFPDGFTLVKAKGHWLDTNHTPHQEPTEIFIVLYRASDAAAMNRRIEQVSKAYIRQFHQESVLRADSSATVRLYTP